MAINTTTDTGRMDYMAKGLTTNIILRKTTVITPPSRPVETRQRKLNTSGSTPQPKRPFTVTIRKVGKGTLRYPNGPARNHSTRGAKKYRRNQKGVSV